MKKKMKLNKIFYLILCIIIIPFSCNGKSINMIDKEKLLKQRVQEMCNLMEKGKFRQTRIFFIPQIQNRPYEEWKEHISSDPDSEGIVDFYKIKSINFRGEIAEIIIEASFLKDKMKLYDYWIFFKGNWYMVDMGRTEVVSSEWIEKYKKFIKDGQK